MVSNLELCIELGDHSVIEIGTIICNDYLWNTVPIDKVMYNESGHNVLGNKSKRGCLGPLCEVINGDENEEVPIRSCRSNLSNHVDPPHYEWPGSSQDV